MTCTCYVCGETVEHTYATYFCSGPSDLCDPHYDQWTKAYNASGCDYDKACEAIGYVPSSKRTHHHEHI